MKKLFLLSLLSFSPVLAKPSGDAPADKAVFTFVHYSCFYVAEVKEGSAVELPVKELALADAVEEIKKENIDIVEEDAVVEIVKEGVDISDDVSAESRGGLAVGNTVRVKPLSLFEGCYLFLSYTAFFMMYSIGVSESGK